MILDSNVIIYSNQPGYETVLDFLDRNVGQLTVSIFTQLKVLGFHKLTPIDRADFERFFASVLILPVNETVTAEATRLKQ